MSEATPGLEEFGYRQQLKRSLGVISLAIFGLAFISPTSPMAIFGVVYNLSHGMVPLVYVVGVFCMAFTAYSYVMMARAFPIAGSVYAYAARAIDARAGFIAGWGMLLDYVLVPALVYVMCAVAVQAILPGIPRTVTILIITGFNTAVSLFGIKANARLNAVLLSVSLVVVVLFIGLALEGLAHGVGGSRVSAAPFFQPVALSSEAIFAALSVAMLNFLGFDGISTLVEEARGGAQAVGRAMILTLFVSAFLFIVMTYLASLFVLGRPSFAPGGPTDKAIYDIAQTIGGSWFRVLVSSKMLFSGLAAAAAAQVSTARMLFSMARDGRIPRMFAHVQQRHQIPDRAILVVGVVDLLVALLLANELELLASLVNFGALFGFLMLHVSVVSHYGVRNRSRDWLRHWIVPAVGFATNAYILIHMATPAKIAGIVWLAIGSTLLILP